MTPIDELCLLLVILMVAAVSYACGFGKGQLSRGRLMEVTL